MVPDMPQKRVTMFFVEGLSDKLKGFIKAHRLNTSDDALGFALDLEVTSYPQQHKSFRNQNSDDESHLKVPNLPKAMPLKREKESSNELRRRNLCFYCK